KFEIRNSNFQIRKPAMSDTPHALLALLSRVKETIAAWLPFGLGCDTADEPLAGKLKDLKWSDPEDEETARRQAAGQAGGDPLARTIYNARPQNPFDKDF
ncbi:MAG TPA: hypothetical protein VND68_03915, partial [Chloroflexia bacterium]|nr:hypothetical protein [Chloroflexia bacterium]